jgi:hypothetical protein
MFDLDEEQNSNVVVVHIRSKPSRPAVFYKNNGPIEVAVTKRYHYREHELYSVTAGIHSIRRTFSTVGFWFMPLMWYEGVLTVSDCD